MNGTEVSVSAGGELALRCNVEGRPDPAITWKKDGAVITDGYIDNRYGIRQLFFSKSASQSSFPLSLSECYFCATLALSGPACCTTTAGRC